MGGTVEIHQCLHGYDDGHELLASSTKFAPHDAYLLSLLSDLSGQDSAREKSGYITGYPLQESSRYVLACTWLATELPRPGCAWTHSLLIDVGDLPAIRDGSKLLHLFRRPTVHNGMPDRELYTRPLLVSDALLMGGERSALRQTDSGQSLTQIISALYGQPETKVFVTPTEAENYSELLTSIWSQQWPKLRRTFRFCSRTLQDRSSGSFRFDLQVLASPRHASAVWNLPDAVVLGGPSSGQSRIHADESWVSCVVNDLLESRDVEAESIGLRPFLWRYGPESAGTRADFCQLARLYIFLSAEQSVDLLELVNLIAQHPVNWTLLAHIVTRPSDDSLPIPNIGALQALRLLLLLPTFGDAVDESLIEQLVTSAWKDAREDVLLLCMGEGSTAQTSKRVRRAVSRIMRNPDDFVFALNAGALKDLVQENPNLVSAAGFWRISRPKLNSVLRYLEDVRFDDDIVRSATRAATSMGNVEGISFFLRRNAESTVFGLLDALSESAVAVDLDEVCELVEGHGSSAMRWASRHSSTRAEALAVVMSAVGYDANGAAAVEAEHWLPLARAPSLWSTAVWDQCRTVLLILALSARSNAAAELAVPGFEFVHDELMRNQLSWPFWQQLRRLLPELPWYQSWDKAERLRLAILNRFGNGSFDRESFFDVVRSASTLKAMLQSDYLTSSHIHFFRGLRDRIDSGSMIADKSLVDVLRKSR